MALIVFLMIMIMNGAAESKIKKVYTTEKDPCPNCADWCRSDPDYTCNYSCDDEGHEDIFNVNCDEKTENIKCIHFARTYPFSDKCDPEVPTDVYPPMLDMVVLDRVTTMTWNYIVTSGKDRHKKFFDWCEYGVTTIADTQLRMRQLRTVTADATTADGKIGATPLAS
uniref:Basic tail protein n=1 Tax=Meloidogyne hapla TaxID=6305 RepID=A0A1I8BY80_MELHA